MKAGWEKIPLGELLDIQNGFAFKSKQFSDTEGLPLVRIRDLNSGGSTAVRFLGDYDARYVVNRGDLLIGMDGEFRCHSWCGGKALLNQRVCKLVDFDSRLEPRFLFYGINKYLKDIEDVTPFTTVKHLSSKTIKAIEFPLPPLEEQQRIVAILDEAFEGLGRAKANAEANLASARELFAVSIETALDSSDGSERTLTELLDDGSIVSHLDGNHGSNYPRKDEFVAEGVPYISANCMRGNAIDMGMAKYLTQARAASLKKGIARNRDVIFAHNATVGPVALLRTDEPAVILSTSVTYYRCDETRIIPEFLMFEMRSAGFRRQYEAVMGQATRNQVPITMQRRFTHKIPSLQDQERIANLGVQLEDKITALVDTYVRTSDQIDGLRQSLLAKAFAGELT